MFIYYSLISSIKSAFKAAIISIYSILFISIGSSGEFLFSPSILQLFLYTHTEIYTYTYIVATFSTRFSKDSSFFFFFFCHFKNLGYISARSQFRLAPVVSPLLFFPSGLPCFSSLSLFRPVLLCETSIFTRLRETANPSSASSETTILFFFSFFSHPAVPFAASPQIHPPDNHIESITRGLDPERLYTNGFFFSFVERERSFPY